LKTTLDKIASILAFIIGAMAIFAGGQALLGKNQFDADGLTAEEQQMLRRLLTRVGDADADAP